MTGEMVEAHPKHLSSKSLPTTSEYLSNTSLSSVAGEVCNKNDREVKEVQKRVVNTSGVIKNEDILNMIIDFIQVHGYPPTVEEIGDIAGLKSKNSNMVPFEANAFRWNA